LTTLKQSEKHLSTETLIVKYQIFNIQETLTFLPPSDIHQRYWRSRIWEQPFDFDNLAESTSRIFDL